MGGQPNLLMAAVGRSVTLDALDGPALPLLRQRISRLVRHTLNQPHCCPCGQLERSQYLLSNDFLPVRCSVVLPLAGGPGSDLRRYGRGAAMHRGSDRRS